MSKKKKGEGVSQRKRWSTDGLQSVYYTWETLFCFKRKCPEAPVSAPLYWVMISRTQGLKSPMWFSVEKGVVLAKLVLTIQEAKVNILATDR